MLLIILSCVFEKISQRVEEYCFLNLSSTLHFIIICSLNRTTKMVHKKVYSVDTFNSIKYFSAADSACIWFFVCLNPLVSVTWGPPPFGLLTHNYFVTTQIHDCLSEFPLIYNWYESIVINFLLYSFLTFRLYVSHPRLCFTFFFSGLIWSPCICYNL